MTRQQGVFCREHSAAHTWEGSGKSCRNVGQQALHCIRQWRASPSRSLHCLYVGLYGTWLSNTILKCPSPSSWLISWVSLKLRLLILMHPLNPFFYERVYDYRSAFIMLIYKNVDTFYRRIAGLDKIYS